MSQISQFKVSAVQKCVVVMIHYAPWVNYFDIAMTLLDDKIIAFIRIALGRSLSTYIAVF